MWQRTVAVRKENIMKKKETKLVRKDGKVYMSGRVYSEESFDKFSDYKVKYEKENYRRFTFRINEKYEPELVEFIESHDYMSTYVKDLIRKDYAKQVKAGKFTPSKKASKKKENK